MNFIYKAIFLVGSIIVAALGVVAQEQWPSPEVEQMYDHARDDMAMGNFTDASVVYKQAIILAPDKMILYKGLGNAFYRLGNYAAAEQTLTPLIARPGADAGCYELLAACQAAQKEMKAAMNTLSAGLHRFPGSGLLYHGQGVVCDLEKNKRDALTAWLEGIKSDPGYALNYYSTALYYLPTEKVTWGLLYAEVYLAMAHDTTGDQELKNNLLNGYKSFFTRLAGTEVPKYGTALTHKQPSTFEEAVDDIYSRLTPVVSDGFSVENLTMVRTRFLMDWFITWGNKYAYALFIYEDELIRAGNFDKYNEELFGKAENATEYDAWNQFHSGELVHFTKWNSEHHFVPAANDNTYNDGATDFLKKK